MSSRTASFRNAGAVVAVLLSVLALVWILFIARGTSFGPAIHDRKDFLITLLNGLTAAGLYFVVASGFTLIFGLMRVVNMAHGAFFLLGGYIALSSSGTGSARAARSGSRAARSTCGTGSCRRSSRRASSASSASPCSRSSSAGTRARSCGRR